MPSAGSVHVDILPDTKRFGPQLRTRLQQMAAKERPTVRVNIRTNTAEVVSRLRAIDHQLNRLDRRRIKIDVVPDLDRFGARLETRLSRVAKDAGAKAGNESGDEFARRFDARLNRLAPKLHRLAQLRIESDAGKARADMVALDKLADRLDGRIVRMRVRTTGVQGLTGGPVGSGGPATQRPTSGRAPSAGAIDSLFQDRLNKALNQLPSFSPDADGARGRLGMLRSELSDLSSRRVGVDMDSGTAMGLVKEMQRELAALSRSRDIDVRVNAARARAELASLQAQANALDTTRPTINVGVRSNKQMEKFSDASPLAVTAMSALIPPAVPLAGAAVGGLAGLLPGLGAGVMGLGAFAGAAIPHVMQLGGAISAQSEAAAGGAKENKAYQDELEKLGPHARGLVEAIGAVRTEYTEWNKGLEVATLPVMTRWVEVATGRLSSFTPVVIGASRGLSNLADSAEKGLDGPYWGRFVSFSARQAEPTLTSLGRTFGWLTLGVTGLAVSFEPLWESMSAGMERSSRSFAQWANDSSNFTGFIDWTITNGPVLLGVLGDLGGAIIDVGVAISPLGLLYAQGIGLLAEGLSWLADTAPGLLQLAVAAVTARMAIQLLSRINQGLIVPLREGASRVAEYAGSLRQVNSAASSAAGGTRGFSGALGGAMGVLGGPWGVAILAATTVLGAFIAKKAEAKQRTDEYTAAIREDAGALGESTRALAAKNLEESGALKLAQQYGISVRDVTDATLGEADAMDRVTASIVDQKEYWEDLYDQGKISASTRDGAITQLMELESGITAETEAMDDSVKAMQRVDEATGAATERQAGLNTELKTSAELARDLNTALSELTGGTIGVTDAEGRFHEAVAAATQAHAENGLTLDQKTEAGRRNHESLVALRDSINQTTEAQRNNDDSAMQMITTHRRGREEFIKVRMGMGETREAAEKLADEYLGIPSEVETAIRVAATGSWDYSMGGRWHGGGAMHGHGHGGLATGGHVRGPGTETSDDIPVMLSDNEFVQRAAAVKKYGVPFMSALNQGRIDKRDLPGFANGGWVTRAGGSTAWDKINSHRSNVVTDYNRLVRSLVGSMGNAMGDEFKKMVKGPKGIIRIAESAVGQHPEVPNGSNRNAITSWFGMNGAPWCAMFISWLFSKANASRALGGASRTAWTGDYYGAGMRRVSDPMPGDVAVYGTRHVNLIASPGGRVRIGGNEGNNVRRSTGYSGGAIFRPNWERLGFASGGLVSMQDLLAQNQLEDRAAGQNDMVRALREAVGLDERPVQRARGGRVRGGQWSWVGEEGPELVQFSSPGQVYSAQQSAAIAAESSQLAAGGDGASAPLVGEYHQHLHNGEATFREGMRELTHTLKVTKKGGRYADA